MDKEKINELLDLISQLNYRQWEMLKTNMDVAFSAMFRNQSVDINEEVKNLICEDLIKNK